MARVPDRDRPTPTPGRRLPYARWRSKSGGLKDMSRKPLVLVLVLGLAAATLDVAGQVSPAAAQPATVTIAGSFQQELGCAADWQPECPTTNLALDPDDGVWQATLPVPTGTWEYKAALDGTWAENYGAGAVRDGPNIALDLAEPTQVKFFYDGASHWVTDNQTSVIATVPGSFQSELGCAGDWDPGCLRSWLQDADGDGVGRFSTSALPPGTYEAKVAIDEAWDENYGAGGTRDGANIPFSVGSAGDVVPFSFAHASHVLDITVTPAEPVDDAALVREPVRHAFVDEMLYFAIPDRFNDGDPGNNCGDFAGTCVAGDTQENVLAHGYLPNQKGYYHGGDLAGLRRQLPYLQGLGVTAIWVGPIFTNKPTQSDTTDLYGHSAGYHGYWIEDFLNVDPHLGTNAEFARLPPGEENAKNPAWLNDPLLYHNRGNTSFTGENSLYGDFFGLDDLWTERREVVEGMVDIYSFWIEEFGVDGFRIDTTKHVNMEFWQKFGPDILAAAEARGIDDFFAFGEVFDQQFGPPFMSEFSTTGQLQSTIDFGFQLAARGFASQSAPADTLRDFFALDDYYTDADSNAYAMPTFLGNHDMGRIGYFLQRVDQAGADDTELLARSQLAHALMFFARGQPVVYYGDEQGFAGDGGDKDAREDMFANTVPSYADNDLIGTDETSADDNFDSSHPLYETIQELAKLSRQNPVLRSGAQIHRYSSDGPGVYAFSRIDRDQRVEYVVALNNGDASATVDVQTFSDEGVGYKLVSRRLASDSSVPTRLTTSPDGALSLTVPPLGVVIYQAAEPAPASDAAPAVDITSLEHGDTVALGINSWDGHQVADRIEVGAELDSDAYAEVTFAVREGDGDYVPVGTDDSPPYRVFYDASHLRGHEDTRLSFRAIVNDLSGHLAADEVVDVGVEFPEPAAPETPYAVIHYARPDEPQALPRRGRVRAFRLREARQRHVAGELHRPPGRHEGSRQQPLSELRPRRDPRDLAEAGGCDDLHVAGRGPGLHHGPLRLYRLFGRDDRRVQRGGADRDQRPARRDRRLRRGVHPQPRRSVVAGDRDDPQRGRRRHRRAGVHAHGDAHGLVPARRAGRPSVAGRSRGLRHDPLPAARRRLRRPDQHRLQRLLGPPRVDGRRDGTTLDRSRAADGRGRVRHRVPRRVGRRSRPARLHPASGRHQGPGSRPVPRLRRLRPRGLAGPGRRPREPLRRTA